VAAELRTNWISTDLMIGLLSVSGAQIVHIDWNKPESITAAAEWFFPYLKRFVGGANYMADGYLIEGVDFLPVQVRRLSEEFEIRAIFLGRSELTLDDFNNYPGRSHGYLSVPEEVRQQIIQHIPMHSEIVRRGANRFEFPYIDMVGDFSSRLEEAARLLSD
jgi:hypothetical protein